MDPSIHSFLISWFFAIQHVRVICVYICPYHPRRTSCVTVDRGLHILPTTFCSLQICRPIAFATASCVPQMLYRRTRCQWCFFSKLQAPWALGLFPGHTSCDRLVASSDCSSLSFFWAVSFFFHPETWFEWVAQPPTSLRFGCITTPTSMIKSCMLRQSYRSYPSFVHYRDIGFHRRRWLFFFNEDLQCLLELHRASSPGPGDITYMRSTEWLCCVQFHDSWTGTRILWTYLRYLLGCLSLQVKVLASAKNWCFSCYRNLWYAKFAKETLDPINQFVTPDIFEGNGWQCP